MRMEHIVTPERGKIAKWMETCQKDIVTDLKDMEKPGRHHVNQVMKLYVFSNGRNQNCVLPDNDTLRGT